MNPFNRFVQQSPLSGVFAQRYDASGNMVDGEFQVNTVSLGDQRTSGKSIAGLSDGGFVAVWTDQSNARDGQFAAGIAQRFGADGAPVGSELVVNTYGTNNQRAFDVAGLKDGGYVIAWTSSGQDGDGNGIFAQRYDASGMAAGNEFQVNTTTTGYQNAGTVAGLQNGGFVVVWLGPELNGSYDIFAQEYNASAIAVGGEVLIADVAGGAYSIDARLDGGYVVAHTTFGSRPDVFAFTVEGSNAIGDEETDIPIAISAALVDADGSETLSDVTISGVPASVTLSAGTDNLDGTWTLTQADLSGLTLRTPDDWNGSFDLTVSATSTETPNGDTATASEAFTVTIDPVNDAPAIETVTSAMPDAGQIAFSDPDTDDTHTATVLGVTATGDESVLGGADAFDFLTLDPVDQATDTVDWTFSMLGLDPASVASGLTGGETLEFEYTVEIADLAADTDLATLTVTLNSDGLFV